eukprot:3526124-Amphidinium_carterae.3
MTGYVKSWRWRKRQGEKNGKTKNNKKRETTKKQWKGGNHLLDVWLKTEKGIPLTVEFHVADVPKKVCTRSKKRAVPPFTCTGETYVLPKKRALGSSGSSGAAIVSPHGASDAIGFAPQGAGLREDIPAEGSGIIEPKARSLPQPEKETNAKTVAIHSQTHLPHPP